LQEFPLDSESVLRYERRTLDNWVLRTPRSSAAFLFVPGHYGGAPQRGPPMTRDDIIKIEQYRRFLRPDWRRWLPGDPERGLTPEQIKARRILLRSKPSRAVNRPRKN